MLYLISLLSFLLPTQLALHAYSPQSTVYGFQIDYLIPTLYLTDIVALLIIFLGFRNLKLNRKFLTLSFLFITLALINIYVSGYFVPSIYKWLKVTEMVLLGVVLLNTKKFDVFKNFVKPLSYSVAITSVLGIWQFLNRGSIGGIFYWLGERSFVFSDPNIAPYPYSTFSHPNSFAGFLLVFAIFLLTYKRKFNYERRLRHKYFWTVLLLIVINLILTNSLNVYVTIALILVIKFVNLKTIAPLIFVDLNARYITHRLELIKSAIAIIKENFWFGVGLNNFIPNLVKVSNTFVNAWELQPVHNIFLLIFSEIGLIGFSLFIYIIASSFYITNYSLIVILLTGLNDHYWLTLQQNMLLFVFVLTLSKLQQKH